MTMQDYTNYCTPEQTIRAYDLGAPIEEYCTCESPHEYYISPGIFIQAPTAEQMLGWLRERGFEFEFIDERHGADWQCSWQCDFDYWSRSSYADEPVKSELSAIDAALDYLEKGE